MSGHGAKASGRGKKTGKRRSDTPVANLPGQSRSKQKATGTAKKTSFLGIPIRRSDEKQALDAVPLSWFTTSPAAATTSPQPPSQSVAGNADLLSTLFSTPAPTTLIMPPPPPPVRTKFSPFIDAAIAEVKAWRASFDLMRQRILSLSQVAQPFRVQELASFCMSNTSQLWILQVFNSRYELIQSLNKQFTEMDRSIQADINGFVVNSENMKNAPVQGRALVSKLTKQAIEIGKKMYSSSRAYFPLNVVVGPSGCGKHMTLCHFEHFMSIHSPLVVGSDSTEEEEPIAPTNSPAPTATNLFSKIKRWTLDDMQVITSNHIINSIQAALNDMVCGMTLVETMSGLPQCLVIENLDQIIDCHVFTNSECAAMFQAILLMLSTHCGETASRRSSLRPMIYITMNATDSFIARRFCHDVKNKFGDWAVSYDFNTQPNVVTKKRWLTETLLPRVKKINASVSKMHRLQQQQLAPTSVINTNHHDVCITLIHDDYLPLYRKLCTGEVKSQLTRSLNMPFVDRMPMSAWLHELSLQCIDIESIKSLESNDKQSAPGVAAAAAGSNNIPFNFKNAMWSVVLPKNRFVPPHVSAPAMSGLTPKISPMAKFPFINPTRRIADESFWSSFYGHVSPSTLLNHVAPMTVRTEYAGGGGGSKEPPISFFDCVDHISLLALLVHHHDLYPSYFDELKETMTSGVMDAMFGAMQPLKMTDLGWSYNFSSSSIAAVANNDDDSYDDSTQTDAFVNNRGGDGAWLDMNQNAKWTYMWERSMFRSLPYENVSAVRSTNVIPLQLSS